MYTILLVVSAVLRSTYFVYMQCHVLTSLRFSHFSVSAMDKITFIIIIIYTEWNFLTTPGGKVL